jgi:hypothetical protein
VGKNKSLKQKDLHKRVKYNTIKDLPLPGTPVA